MDMNSRILIVDDNESIHEDFRRVLMPPKDLFLAEMSNMESSLFGELLTDQGDACSFRLDFAFSGEEAIVLFEEALASHDPYALVFTDVRMPPGLDGIELVGEIWKRAPETEVVIVTAYSDYSWDEMYEKLGQTEHLFFIRKPFDTISVKQIASTLTKKWSLGALAREQMASLKMSQLVMDKMGDAVIWFRPNGSVFSVNEAACGYLSCSEEQLKNMSFFQLCTSFSQDQWTLDWQNLAANGSLRMESQIQSEDNCKPVEMTLSHMTYESDEFGCAVIRDISVRKSNEERLSKLEERWRFLWESVPDTVIELDADGTILICNRIFRHKDGSKAIGHKFFDYIPRSDHLGLGSILDDVSKTGTQAIYDFSLHKGGEKLWFSLRIIPIKNTPQDRLLIIGSDITERKQAETALIRSELRLAEAQHMAQVGNWEWDLENERMFWSDEMFRLCGFETEVEPPALDIFVDRAHPEDQIRLVHDITRASNDGSPFKGEFRFQLPSGHTRVLFITAQLEFEAGNQRRKRLVGTAQNISELRAVEEERAQLEAQLQQVQKMETLGTLAGGIAHDFNNILTPIIGYSEMAAENVDENDRVHQDISQALKAAYRAKDLVRQILIFSRRVNHERQPIEPGLIVKEVARMIRAWVPTTINIRTNIARETLHIMADPTQIHQVLMNLCTNAYHAMKISGGTMSISLDVFELQDTRHYPGLEKGRFARIAVKDSGTGMDETVSSRIFEPFFTTKEVGDGTGLGLSVVHGIITGHDGIIQLETEPGKGSTFTILLPIVTLQQEKKQKPTSSMDKGVGRILFVDDEEVIAEMAGEMLHRMGYEVTTKTSSLEALATYVEAPDRFDVVITDQTMPNMTGIELAKAIFARNPEQPIILITGFSEQITDEITKREGICELLTKPIQTKKLSQILQQHMPT